MSNLNDDIRRAQNIIINGNNNQKIYHENSFIFLTTNEKINNYQKYLKNKNKVLSVIGSSDQILNTILGNSLDIDAFDISSFPKYLTDLKRAGILALDLEQYKKFFFADSFKDEDFFDDMYDLISKNLDYSKEFWNYFFDFYEYSQVFNSPLFSSQTNSLKSIISNNAYLDKANYQRLKELIPKANLSFYDGDIRSLSTEINTSYDLVNLSSIIYYENNYKEILKNISLNDEGIILTYLYKVGEDFINYYSDCIFEKFKDSDEGVMIYKKKLR